MTNWQKTLLGGTAKINDVHGVIRGGNVNTNFSLGGGYHTESTIYPGNFGFKRISTNLTIDHQSDDGKLKAQVSVNYGYNKSNQFDDANYTRSALILPPNAPNLYKENGGVELGATSVRNE